MIPVGPERPNLHDADVKLGNRSMLPSLYLVGMQSENFKHPNNNCASSLRECLGLRLKEVADLAMRQCGSDGIHGENDV